MDMPGEQAATARTTKVVASAPVDGVPGRLVDQDVIDRPEWQAGPAAFSEARTPQRLAANQFFACSAGSATLADQFQTPN
jgi:hypothetical protein